MDYKAFNFKSDGRVVQMVRDAQAKHKEADEKTPGVKIQYFASSPQDLSNKIKEQKETGLRYDVKGAVSQSDTVHEMYQVLRAAPVSLWATSTTSVTPLLQFPANFNVVGLSEQTIDFGKNEKNEPLFCPLTVVSVHFDNGDYLIFGLTYTCEKEAFRALIQVDMMVREKCNSENRKIILIGAGPTVFVPATMDCSIEFLKIG
jgi:hypothetical protein